MILYDKMPAADAIAMMKCKIFNRSIATSLQFKGQRRRLLLCFECVDLVVVILLDDKDGGSLSLGVSTTKINVGCIKLEGH